MASFVISNGSFNTTAGAHTGAITPGVGSLILSVVGATGDTSQPTVTDDQGGTYTAITSALFNTSADALWLFVRNQLTAAAVLTTATMTPGGTTTGGGGRIYEFSGITRKGPTAIRQVAKQENQAASTTPAPAFALSALTGNATIGWVMNGTNVTGLTVPAGWTQNHDSGYINPPSGLQAVTRNSGFTGTTVTWGSASASAFASLIVELDNNLPDIPYRNPMPPLIAQ